jgi:hypothetical protein
MLYIRVVVSRPLVDYQGGALSLLPGARTLHTFYNYTGGIDWKVQLMSMPSFFKRYARAM